MELKANHRYHVEMAPYRYMDIAAGTILALKDRLFDSYENPFESKLTLKDKWNLPATLRNIIHQMEADVSRVRELFGIPNLIVNTNRHYCGIFKYLKGGRLGVHVDAGIHPKSGQRKHVTAVLYLGKAREGALELWNGTSCTDPEPRVDLLLDAIEPEHGKLVFFENNDYAWHGMTPYQGQDPRIVVTVSYLSDSIDLFENKRQRAYFVPRPDENWPPETYELRDSRADNEKHKEVYRV